LPYEIANLVPRVTSAIDPREYTPGAIVLGLEVVVSSIKRLARAATTWLIRAGLGNDLATLSDRDLRDVGLVREQIGKTSKLFVLT
jgi:uncharacterized protein YjiS (DUF1127 family)